MKNTIELNGFNGNICAIEAFGLSKVFAAYSDNAAGEEIMSIGFNPNSGYVYIALENGVSICSCMGKDVEYLVADFEDGEEYFFDNIEDAEIKQATL